jgi:hypothetical protein
VEALERRELLSVAPFSPIPTFTAPARLTSVTTPTITWTADAGPTRYDLWVDDATTGTHQLIRQQNLLTNSFTPVIPLTVGHQYTAWVEAFNSGGQTAGWSQPLSFTVAAIVPPTITGPASATSATTPTITWVPSSGAASYDLWVNDTTTGVVQLRQKNLITNSFTPVAPLTQGHHYTVWVEAFTNSGVGSGWGQPFSFSIVAATPTITGPVGSISATMPSITWTTSAGAMRYELWISDITSSISPLIREPSLTSTSFTLTTPLTVGHQYTAWIRSFDNNGKTSGWSPPASFSVVATVPPTFTAPAASTTGTPAITWTASSGAVYYDLWVNDTSAKVSQVIRRPNLSGTSFTPATPLTIGHQYTAWIKAFTASGQSGGWSQPLTFSIIATTPPALIAPTGSSTSTLPTITWNTSVAAANYELWLTDVTAGIFQAIDRKKLTTTAFTPSVALTAGHQYTAWVAAFNATGQTGGWSQPLSFLVQEATSSPPTAAFTNSGPVAQGATATVSFSGASGGSGGYNYSYDFNNDGTFEISGSSSTQATVPASDLSAAGSHVVHGRITDSSGAFTDYTTTISVNGGSSSGHTYYVATTGDDDNSGSADAPFATLQHAIMSLQPGDMLNVEPGSYAGFVAGWDSIPASSGDQYGTIEGTANAPITIQADPNAAPGSVIINKRANEVRYGIDLEPGCQYVNLIGFTIADSGGITTPSDRGGGIKIADSNDAAINNTITNIVYGFGIIADNANNVLLKDNTITGVGSQGNDNYGHGIYLSGSLDGAVVQGNVIYNNDLIGIHINGDVGEGGVGLVTHALIEDNLIYNNGQNGINADGLESSVIENNLIYGYQSFGIALYQIDAADGSKNNVIVNNTIVSTVSGAGAAIRILDGGTGNTILNNILLGGGDIALRISNDSLPGLVSNYNIGGSSYFESEDDGSNESLDQWRVQSGQDASSQTAAAESLFANAAANNYHLAPGSPALHSGTNRDAPPTDMLGAVRLNGQIDIGAYQG